MPAVLHLVLHELPTAQQRILMRLAESGQRLVWQSRGGQKGCLPETCWWDGGADGSKWSSALFEKPNLLSVRALEAAGLISPVPDREQLYELSSRGRLVVRWGTKQFR